VTHPSYHCLAASGELARRAQQLSQRLQACDVCAHCCGVDRSSDVRDGQCGTGRRAVVANSGPHFGEEDPLVGSAGSGTIFFSGCNLACQFCQNYDISQLGHGREVEPEELARQMLSLQAQGCHNVNLVSPSHVVPQILAALVVAVEEGLRIPLVYNTGGYDSLETLQALEGVVDIYMPDMKYADAEVARTYSGIEDYPRVNREAVREMYRQVGDLELDEEGVALRGVLVRHLVLPEGLGGTAEIVSFLRDEISPGTYLNVMAQYRPCYRARQLPSLDRSVTRQEYIEAVQLAEQAGLRLDRRQGRVLWL